MTALPFSIDVETGVPLSARIYECHEMSQTDPWLVLAHGAGAGQSHPFMVRYATALAARGVTVVTFDFPYMQAGRRSPDRAPILEQAFRQVVVAAVRQPRVPAGPLFIGGKSMGGRMATHLAAAVDDWPDAAPPLAGVIALGYPLNPPGGSRRSPDRVSHLARIAVPLLVVQGTRDTFGGPDDIRGAAPHAQVHAVETGDHSFAVRKSAGQTQEAADAAVCDAIVRFIRGA